MAVVGAGIVGLGAARELLARHPRLRVAVLERESRVAAHQTGHNSGVIHAGIYYAPGSLKARLCVQGARELYAYCERHGIAHRRCGKVIVAISPRELPGLAELERRGRANGVPGLRRLRGNEIADVEPHVRGIEALHSPATGVVDYAAVARRMGAEALQAGATLSLGCEITDTVAEPSGVTLHHAGGRVRARRALFCAGAWADRVARRAGASADPRIVPFHGGYLNVRPDRGHLVRALVYPVPDPALPFLGIHLTRGIEGSVHVGPTALMAGARDAYALRRVVARDLLETLSWPGTWRMARRWWRTAMIELGYALSWAAIARAAARYVPELGADDLVPGFSGVRAQALGHDGKLIDDFVVSTTGSALHIRNAPSPAATAALPLARLVADRCESELGLTG